MILNIIFQLPIAEYCLTPCFHANVEKIDSVNILNASIHAMHNAINKIIVKMGKSPELLLIDGNRFKS